LRSPYGASWTCLTLVGANVSPISWRFSTRWLPQPAGPFSYVPPVALFVFVASCPLSLRIEGRAEPAIAGCQSSCAPVGPDVALAFDGAGCIWCLVQARGRGCSLLVPAAGCAVAGESAGTLSSMRCLYGRSIEDAVSCGRSRLRARECGASAVRASRLPAVAQPAPRDGVSGCCSARCWSPTP
jgi:hypothetical protein